MEGFKKMSREINALIKEKNYSEARKKGTVLLNNEELTDDEGAVLYNQMATIEARTGFFIKAKDYINKAFDIYPNMQESQKCLMKRQLIFIETQRKDLKGARNLINELLNDLPEDEQLAKTEEIKLKSQLLHITVLELNREEAMILKDELLNNLSGDEDIDNRTKEVVEDKLRLLEELEKKSISKNKPQIQVNNKFYERFNNGNILTSDDVKIIEASEIAQRYYKGTTSKYSRSNLYSGKIQFNELQELTDENKDNLPGCIFIAEACQYFGLERMGKQCIQGYKMDNTNLSDEEIQSLNKAMDILNESSVTNGFSRQKWNQIYADLAQYFEKEENDIEI